MKTKNMKNLVGALALAWAASAMPQAARAAGGDVISIFPVDESGASLATPVVTRDAPLQAGAKVRFAVRVNKRLPTDTSWAMTYVGPGSSVVDELYNPLKIGVYVSGELRYAAYDGDAVGGTYTDFFFAYEVKPGDFALPVVLAVGQDSPQPANAAKLLETAYHVSPQSVGKWAIRSTAEGGAGAVQDAVLSFSQSSGVEDPDYDLRGAGFYVKTVDFDEDEEDDAWRAVPAGTSRTGTIHVDSVPTNTATFYVWSMDESVVAVQGSQTLNVHTSADTVETRKAAVVKLVAGQQDYSFRFTAGADAAGQSAKLVLSGFDDFTYAYGTTEAYEDHLLATVKVTEAPDPYMTLTDASGNNKVTVEATTNTSAYTEMRLRFSKAFESGPVTVALKQQIDGVDVSEEDDYIANRYVAILLDPDGDPVSTASLKALTMPAGETELRFYVFGLGSATALKTPGLTLVPDVSAQPEAVQAFFAKGVANQKNGLLKVVDQAPAVSVTAPSSGFKNDTIAVDVTVADNWRDLQAAWNEAGYRVAIKLGGQTVLDTNGVHFAEGESQSFSVKIPLEGHPLKGAVLVYDATHGTTASQADFEIEVEPALSATPAFYRDSSAESERYPDGYFFSEGESPYFRVNLTAEASENMYAFLVPQNEAASNLVECSACSNGLLIASGKRTSSAATLTFLDGFSSKEPMRALFKVDLRNLQQIDAEGSVSLGSTYELNTVELACVNVSPTIVAGSMEMNSTPVESGGTLMSRIPVGVEVKFRARVNDLSPVDLAAKGDKAIVTRWQITDGAESRQSVYTRFATNENGYVSCPFTFGYQGTTQTVTVWARDKDDLEENGDLDWGNSLYTFTVNVEESPRVIISQDNAGETTEFQVDENVARKYGFFYVQLSEQPIGYADGSLPISKSNPLAVELVSQAWGSDGFMALETNLVYFTGESNDQKVKKVYYDLDSLNGGYDTTYQVTARVATSNCSNAYDQAWSDYYASGSVEITVNNVEPSIDKVNRTNGKALVESGTNTCSAGETIALHWKVSDVLPDVTNGNMTVTWSLDPSSDSPTTNPQTITNGWAYTTSGRKTSIEGDYVFTAPTSAGTTTLSMTVDDGDGGVAVKEWVIYIAPTKRIKVNMFGPAETSEGKYSSAAGLGQGVVAAVGTEVAPLCEAFIQYWDYKESDSSAELYAWGYPSKATWDSYVTADSQYYGDYRDRGQIPGVLGSSRSRGVALNSWGYRWTAGDYYDWSTMGGRDATAGDYDNYFYRWMIVDSGSDSKSGSGGGSSQSSQSNPDPAPTAYPLAQTTKSFALGTSDGTANADMVTVEAVFSRELYPKDNLGDINADGIPDRVVMHFGINASETGKMPDDDLTDISALNDDEDYLPNFAGSTYSTLIPGLPSSWTDGTKFTALLEIRGYHEGLNNAAELFLPAMKNVRLEADYYSDDVEKRKAARDYSELEMVAWSLTGYAKDWTPECPSNPTIDDTDNDGFTDGYEYYFWYRAHVGDLEYFAQTGEYRKLTGRRYDPKNPGVGTVITSEEIEKLMNPREAYGSGESASLVDTDNDGLPDLLEYELGTNPFDFDTDGDGLPDGWEIMIAGLDPLTAQSYVDGLSDTERNTDGDAMAISSYKLEQSEKPVPVNIEHAKRWTLAVIDADGDTDGVQWYAMADKPEVTVGETFTGGYSVAALVDGATVTFFSATEPETAVTEDGVARLKADTTLRRLVDYEDTDAVVKALGYPYALPAGSRVTVSAIEAGVEVRAYVAPEVTEGNANACWIYGRGTARTRLGEVADSAAEYGCLALARQKAVPEGAAVVAMPSDKRDVAFLHFLCYQEFGFDPRTAWSPTTPLHKRWGQVANDEVVEGSASGYTGVAARTRAYANYDEFLVCSFFWNNEGGQPGCVTYVTDEKAPEWARLWGALTTNPQGPNDAEKTSSSHYYGRSSTNGADTDGDGVPDGWELYVMAGPKTEKGVYVFAPPYDGFTPAISADEDGKLAKSYFSPFVDAAQDNHTLVDGLNQYQEFEGTDTMLYYADYSTTVVHKDGWSWYNKFFPTDPWNADTDGDGVNDADEKGAFAYAETEYDDAKHGALCVIPGGGLNPNSVDTDLDGLPDGWEMQFAGSTVYEKDGTRDETKGYVDGMDGTVFDAYTKPGDINRDYDNDGLENWQEYLTGTMRCWRYDDPVSPLTYIPSGYYYTRDETTGLLTFDPESAAKKLNEAGLIESDDVNEFWYRTLVDATSPAYNPHLVTDMSSGAQYFSRVTNVWDAAYLEPGGKVSGAYYWFCDRIDEHALADVWGAAWESLAKEAGVDFGSVAISSSKYVSCSPIDPDTDHDGMDDYYEVFHGMNPLLGRSGVVKNSGGYDVIYDALYSADGFVPSAWSGSGFGNYWQIKASLPSWTGKTPRGTGYDFEAFPWLNGLADADPDGDGIRNQEEAIMLLEPQSAWHHTDPTPLWMTDSTYSNSLVRMNYRLPYRASAIPLTGDGFTFGGKTYSFSDFDGYVSDDSGASFASFNLDAWKVVGAYNASGWIASFEQNEGYDTDHDGIADRDELQGKFRGKTDPLDVDSPQRRQAMYFQGPERPSILQTMPFVREHHPLATRAGEYPDDLSFLQYTVECWVKAESLADSTVIERAIVVGESSPDDREFVRCNFQLGIKSGKWYTKFDPNDTTRESVEVFGDDTATTAWTHLAATYDAKTLVLYVNGRVAGSVGSGLQPTYGTKLVATHTPGRLYLGDAEYGYHAIVIGASVKTNADGYRGYALDVTLGRGWDEYKNFFKGYVDEVRVWDGARTATEIKSARMKRFTAEDAKANRESFFAEWSQGSASGDLYRGRYAKDGSGNPYVLPAELRFHWAFDSLFGAAEEGAVAKVPAGFSYEGDDSDTLEGARARLSRPDGYGIAWWQDVLAGYTGTVYDDPAWICWVPNTVTHLPRYDGTTLDSRYWSEDYQGDEPGTYRFARTAEPVSFWTQQMRGDVKVGESEYFAMGSRYHLVAGDAAVTNAQFETLFEFTGRHLNQVGDDMLALGGAFAKHVDDLWDSQGASSNWEISGADEDGDGLPDWWEKWADEQYRDSSLIGDDEFIGWNTIVRWPDQSGTLMPAWEAYLRDLARGYHGDKDDNIVRDDAESFRQRYDLDGNGIPDWWEELYGVTGEGAFDDHDNDGLCNLVEYLLSECFEVRDASGARKLFNPAKARSVLSVDPDYFFRIGSLYVGEVFSDHDFIEDWWERQYSADYVSTLVYDTATDNDDDGWSAFAESRYSQQVSPIVADGKFHYDVTSGYVADHPVPAVQLKVKYNGARAAEVESSSMSVRIGRDLSAAKSVDATYQIAGSKAVNASQPGSGVTGTPTSSTVSTSNEYKRLIGKWSDRRVYGTLTPGFIKANSIRLQVAYDPSSTVYSWSYAIGAGTYYGRGTYEEYLSALRKYADVTLLSTDDSFANLLGIQVRTDLNSEVATLSFSGFAAGKTLGTVNLKTGEYDLDLGIFKDGYVQNGTNSAEVSSLEDQTYRIVYSANASTGLPRDLYLGEADTGYVREGKNQVMVWADLDNDGEFTVGEPFGYVRDLDVGWRRCTAEVELFDHSPVMPRLTLAASSTSSSSSSSSSSTSSSAGMDRGMTVTAYVQALKDKVMDMDLTDDARDYMLQQLAWAETNKYASATLDTSSTELTRVRIVRWAVDGQPVYRLGVEPETVFDQKMLLSNRAFLTEADILSQGGFDLDWDKLKKEVVDYRGVQLFNTPVTNVAYLVVIGDGKTYWNTDTDTNSCPKILDRVIERRYGLSQAAAAVYAPKSEGSVVYAARPTFKWTIPGEDDSDYTGYTAFQLQILPMGSDTPVWTSGTRLLPPRDSYGRYVWTAPAYVGNDLETSVNYRWRVSVMNAKFPTPNWKNADVGCFRMESGAISSDYGSVRVCVRYFGPKAEVLDVGTVRVEAFESPDFTGDPVARAAVPATEKTAISTVDSAHVAQVELKGLPCGDYYLRAYVDSDEYGTKTVRDSWESWGYLCDRSGDASTLFAPTTVTVSGGAATASGDVPTIYIEDTDVNGNRIPDAYEMHVNGGSLDNGAVKLDETLDCGLAVMDALLDGQLTSADYSSLVTYCADALRLRGLASLALGVPASSVSVDSSGKLQVINRVESVSIESMSLEGGQVRLKVTSSATAASGVDATAATIYGATTTTSAKQVTCRVFRTETLSPADWKEVATETIPVGTAEVAVDLPDTADTAGFYRVVIEED